MIVNKYRTTERLTVALRSSGTAFEEVKCNFNCYQVCPDSGVHFRPQNYVEIQLRGIRPKLTFTRLPSELLTRTFHSWELCITLQICPKLCSGQINTMIF